MAFPVVASFGVDNTFGGGTAGPLPNITATGIAVGDLILSYGVGRNSAGPIIINPIQPSTGGWTMLYSNNGAAFYKVATSLEVAAATLAPDFGGYGTNYTSAVAAVVRITGADTTTPIQSLTNNSATGTAMTTGGVTPITKQCLLVLIDTSSNAAGGGTSNTASGYAVVNSNPTWTESFDSFDRVSTTRYGQLALAWGNYAAPLATATGTASATLAISYAWSLELLAIQPQPIIPTPLVLLSTVNTPAFLRRLVVTSLALISSVGTPIFSSVSTKWKNLKKTLVDMFLLTESGSVITTEDSEGITTQGDGGFTKWDNQEKS